jgi:hypothetical protein
VPGFCRAQFFFFRQSIPSGTLRATRLCGFGKRIAAANLVADVLITWFLHETFYISSHLKTTRSNDRGRDQRDLTK